MSKKRPPQERRSGSQLLVLMTEEERKQIDAAARVAGLPTGGWLRMLGLREARKMNAKGQK